MLLLHRLRYFYHTIILFGAVVFAFVYFRIDQVLRHHVDMYAISRTEQLFGSYRLAQHQEEFIKQIASEMAISDEGLLIKKMNVTAMRLFGYYNAFAYSPSLLSLIPISTIQFLFVSEGFFEDLSPEEQRFLIGHELAHIKARDALWFQLMRLLLLILSLVTLFLIGKMLKQWIQNNFSYYLIPLYCGGMLVSFVVAFNVADCCLGYYHRIRERAADYSSLITLQSYDGCITLFDRWAKDFQMTSDVGLSAKHPPLIERKNYCLLLQNQFNQKDIAC